MTAQKLLEHILAWYDQLPDIKLDRKCKLVQKDHEEDKRVYAHVFHRRGRVICLCRAFDRLALPHKLGILLHEIGHLMSNGGEAEADLWVNDNLDIDIDFRNTLQWVDPAEVGGCS